MHYAPEPNFITKDLAEGLVEGGHNVVVLTAYPNYPYGNFYKGAFKLYPTIQKENGVIVVRVPHYPSHSGSSIVRLASYLSFTLTCFIPALCIGLFFHPRRVIVYQTPFFTALLAIPLKLLSTQLTYICADLWPESLIAVNKTKTGILTRALFLYSTIINKFADNLITSTRGMKARYVNDGIKSTNVEFVPVWVDGIPDPLPSPFCQVAENKRVTFAGNIGPSQGLDVFVRAFSSPKIRDLNVELCFVGVGSELERLKSLASGTKNIIFKGRVSPEEAFTIQRESAAVIAHLIPAPEFELTLPSKLSVCLAVGNVFLCGVNGEANRMFQNYSSVRTFKSGDLDAIIGHIIAVSAFTGSEIEEMGKSNQEIYLAQFSKKALLKQYLDICSK